MKLLLLLLVPVLSFSLFSSVYAQSGYTITGKVTDTAAVTPLTNAPVSLLRAKDSILITFTRINSNGIFEISKLRQGEYILLITCPDYADYVEKFVLDSLHKSYDFGLIKLKLKATILQEVLIKAKTAVTMNGDTTEFNAGSYIIQPNSKVEDLLRQLPGIQVDRNGKIRAQGETVSTVLVDGEPFFGDDPTFVTRNIRGDMVETVQLYDKKSDFATLTGLDDGKKKKTINIKLKEDKKVGYFGKVEAGWAESGYNNQQGMANYFTKRSRFSIFETFNDIGKTGLGLMDNSKYGFSSGSSSFSAGGLLIVSSPVNDYTQSWTGTGRYNGEGIPVTRSGAAHFDTRWNNATESINGDYILNSLAMSGNRETISFNNLPGNILRSNWQNSFDNSMMKQGFNVVYQNKFSAASSLRITSDGVLKNFTSDNRYKAINVDENNNFINQSDRMITNKGNDGSLNFNMLWTRVFKKQGRYLSAGSSGNFYRYNASGFLNNQLRFHNPSSADSLAITDQRKSDYFENQTMGLSANYVEPINKAAYLSFSYSLGLNSSEAVRNTFNKTSAGQYNLPDSAFSNDYNLRQFFSQGGATIYYNKGKTRISLGTGIAMVLLKQADNFSHTVSRRSFLNWAPQVNYAYNFSKQGSLNLRYSGASAQPSLEQIQDVKVNIDPLNVFEGNPQLRPAFNHRINFTYSLNKTIPVQHISLNLSGAVTEHPLVSIIDVDAKGRSVYRMVNLNGKNSYNYTLSFEWFRKIKKIDLNAVAALNSSASVYYNIINNKLTQINMYSYSPQFVLSQNKEMINFDFHIGPDYYILSSFSEKKVNSNGKGFSTSMNFDFRLPGKMEFKSYSNYTFQAKTASFDRDFSRFILNASMSKKFLKSQSLQFAVQGNDLLNQNNGFSRSASNSLITQSSYNTLKRYVLFSLIYDFNKSVGSK